MKLYGQSCFDLVYIASSSMFVWITDNLGILKLLGFDFRINFNSHVAQLCADLFI